VSNVVAKLKASALAALSGVSAGLHQEMGHDPLIFLLYIAQIGGGGKGKVVRIVKEFRELLQPGVTISPVM
jgi:hypothetical protein